MQVLVVGGAGDMGRVACETIAGDPSIASVVVADRDETRALQVAQAIGPKASSQRLDITDDAGLRSALGAVDLVINTVGPFYLFGRPVLEAAIASRTHYIDIADDWEPTIEMFELHGKAVRAEVTAIVGMGASPGISNLLAAAAHAQLDTVDTLNTVWRGGVGIPPVPDDPATVKPSAAIDHWLHNLAVPIQIWRDGAATTADALEEFAIDYPGIGSATLWTCGHPEPISLPRSFPEIKHSVNAMFGRRGLMDVARRLRDRVRNGELSVPEASRELLLTPGRHGPSAGALPDFPGAFAYAAGTKDERRARAFVTTPLMPSGGMGRATCIPTALAAVMLARGEITGHGVMGPEGFIVPVTLVERLAPFAGERAGEAPLDVRIVLDDA
ncbi:saccharopine dehydrogenase family protein [Streptomyces spongiae]|uniref:Saccharopine dehydrogenase n=1 Tax=Streptomyces spongiae TaxID=565072 RepID=A0A5N8XCZ0_9ACTN|nr:saccharopine dehydrogenase NADP-binding domain-containing protein [Streptomyces spongiae]MPY56395.1 saccharopine dehydrogenase [Streptomyces spongiae]